MYDLAIKESERSGCTMTRHNRPMRFTDHVRLQMPQSLKKVVVFSYPYGKMTVLVIASVCMPWHKKNRKVR